MLWRAAPMAGSNVATIASAAAPPDHMKCCVVMSMGSGSRLVKTRNVNVFPMTCASKAPRNGPAAVAMPPMRTPSST